MRRFSVCVLLAVICPGIASSQREAKADLLIANIAIVDTQGRATRTATVVTRGGTIDAVLQPGAPVPEAVTTVDGRGKFLIPGLWDMHVHLATNREPQFAERMMLSQFLAHGIVGVRDMGGPLERLLALRDRVNDGTLQGPRIITPGPFLDGAGDPDPMFMRATTAGDARNAVRELAKAGVDFVKVQANLTREPYDAAIEEARSRHLPVAGHVPVFIPVSHIVSAGQRSIEHISPALVGDAGLLFACSRREDELRQELMAIERERANTPRDQIRARESRLRTELVESFDPDKAASLGRSLKKQQIWVVPTLIWSNSFPPLQKTDIGAAIAKAASKAVGALHAAGAPLLAGTDTYDRFVLPGASLHQEFELLAAAGLSPLEVLQTATWNAALFRNAIDVEGTVGPGKRADLVILDADPLLDVRNLSKIHAVIVNGRLR